jgi:hypothetical protein
MRARAASEGKATSVRDPFTTVALAPLIEASILLGSTRVEAGARRVPRWRIVDRSKKSRR